MQNRILRKEKNPTPTSQQEHASICALNCTITSLNWDIAFEIFCWGSRIELSCWLYRHVAGGVERLCSSSRDSPLSHRIQFLRKFPNRLLDAIRSTLHYLPYGDPFIATSCLPTVESLTHAAESSPEGLYRVERRNLWTSHGNCYVKCELECWMHQWYLLLWIGETFCWRLKSTLCSSNAYENGIRVL